MIYYFNGNFVSEDEAKISVLDHGFLYGDGVFEGIRAYNGRIFALDEHVDRFYESAHSIMLEIPLCRNDLKEAILETVRQNNLQDAYIRPVASRGVGVGPLGLDPTKCPKATLVIIVDADIRPPAPSGEIDSKTKNAISAVTVATRRNGPDVLSPRVKSTNYLNNILAKLQAYAAGAQEAIFLNAQGYVSEFTGDNIFIVKHSRLITPPLWMGVLNGVTRQTILRIVRDQKKLEVLEEPFSMHDVYTSDECFATATRVEIVPVVSVDGRRIGDGGVGPVTVEIKRSFNNLVTKEGTLVYKK